MALPRKTPNSVRYARMTARGCLTRLALYFDARREQSFRGDEVTAILLEAVMAVGSPEEFEYPLSEPRAQSPEQKALCP